MLHHYRTMHNLHCLRRLSLAMKTILFLTLCHPSHFPSHFDRHGNKMMVSFDGSLSVKFMLQSASESENEKKKQVTSRLHGRSTGMDQAVRLLPYC